MCSLHFVLLLGWAVYTSVFLGFSVWESLKFTDLFLELDPLDPI